LSDLNEKCIGVVRGPVRIVHVEIGDPLTSKMASHARPKASLFIKKLFFFSSQVMREQTTQRSRIHNMMLNGGITKTTSTKLTNTSESHPSSIFNLSSIVGGGILSLCHV
jgi:hypothetical protein